MIAKTIRTCFPVAAAAVSDKAEEINKLNVFPVPDGDTGTNMSLTMGAAAAELSKKSFPTLGAAADCRDWDSAAEWGRLSASVTVHKGEAIFPRIDMEKALAELEAIQEAQKKAALPALEIEPLTEEKVDFDTFCRSDFRVVKVKACEAVKKSDKLLRFTLDDGTGTDRQILSGIHKFYEPEELVGKTLAAS